MNETVYDEEGVRLTFWIPDENMEALKAKLAALSKKGEKWGLDPVFMMPIGFKDETVYDNYVHRVWEVLIAGTVHKIEGWAFNARIDYDHNSGNLVTASPGRVVPECYHSIDSICEHCNKKRRRRTGYLLQHTETAEYKVVGSSCLNEFFNQTTPDKIAKYFETIRKTIETAKKYSVSNGYTPNYLHISLPNFVECVLETINVHGWYGSTEARNRGDYYNSTASRAHTLYKSLGSSPNHTTEANTIISWAASMTDEEVKGNMFLNNIRIIARDGRAKISDENFIAGMVRAYQNKFKKPTPTFDVTKSTHIGVTGDKVNIDVTVLSSFRSKDNTFDVIKMIDANGNVYVWFNHGSSKISKDETLKVQGTIKAHNEYKGIKETVLTRVKRL